MCVLLVSKPIYNVNITIISIFDDNIHFSLCSMERIPIPTGSQLAHRRIKCAQSNQVCPVFTVAALYLKFKK